MKKSILSKLPVEPLRTEIILEDITYHKYNSYKNYLYQAAIDKSSDEEILLIDIFRPSGEFIRRYFQDKNGEYFSIDDKGKMYTSGIENFQQYSHKYFGANKQTNHIILDFFGLKDEEDTLSIIKNKQSQYRAKKLNERHDKIRESINNQMLEIRTLPKSVYDWVDNVLMIKSRYLFYEYNNTKKVKATCSFCGEDVKVIRKKDGEIGSCPSCKTKATYKPLNRFLNSGMGHSDISNFCYIQKVSNGFVARFYTTNRYFIRENYKKPRINIEETRRIFYEYNQWQKEYRISSEYEWKKFLSTDYMNWSRKSFVNDCCELIYTNNLNKVLKNEDFKSHHVNFNLIAKRVRGRISVDIFIKNTYKYKIIGTLVNEGFYEFAKGLINNSFEYKKVNKNAKSLKEILNANKYQLIELKRLNPSYNQLMLYYKIIEKEGYFDKTIYDWIDSNIKYHQHNYLFRFGDTRRIIDYLIEQKKQFSHHIEYKDVLIYYKDYMESVTLLLYNLKNSAIRYPKNLQLAHDIANSNVKVLDNSHYGKAIENMADNLNSRFFYRDKNFLIKAPSSHIEIIDEGEKLSHCVTRYIKDIVLQKTVILFIRQIDKPDVPYYTLELSETMTEVVQNLGKNNCMPTDEVKKFIHKWSKLKLLDKNKKERLLCL